MQTAVAAPHGLRSAPPVRLETLKLQMLFPVPGFVRAGEPKTTMADFLVKSAIYFCALIARTSLSKLYLSISTHYEFCSASADLMCVLPAHAPPPASLI